MSLNFVCVNAGDYLGKGKEYVEILHDMIVRNLAAGTEGRFICFTDDETPYAPGIEKRPLHGGLKGWWNKLYLFKDGLFEDGDRIVFFDLDTVIVSGLDEIIKYDGEFAILEDFYRPGGFQSSVMMWTPNIMTKIIWGALKRIIGRNDDPQLIYNGGDQQLIEEAVALGQSKYVDIIQKLYPNCFVSYKVHATSGIPQNAKVVVFHGNPRPHKVGGWVEKIWKIDGGSSLEMDMMPNVAPDKLEENIRYCLSLNLPRLSKLNAPTDFRSIFVGGGPSLNNYAFKLEEMALTSDVFALNGSYAWLKERGVLADYHVIADARPENAQFIDPDAKCTYLIASHCDKSVFDAVKDKTVIVWHRGHDGMQDIVDPKRDQYIAYISGGSTVGMVSLSIAYTLGYRDMHIFGYDSSYLGNEGHAYSQPLNDDDRTLEVDVYDRTFKSSPWMVAQVNEYMMLAPTLVEMGCQITTYGDGMLQHANQWMAESALPESEIEEKDGIWWPSHDFECKASVEHFIDDAAWIMGFCTNFDVAVQAGGNVGMWPKKLAEKFKTVYTFEPDNINFQCLVRNCTEPNIVKIQAGLGDKHSMFGLQTTRHNCGAHFVDGEGIYPTFRIDDLKLPKCDLIQLDIEGFEFFAIQGGFLTMTNHRPVIVMEIKGLGEKFGYTDYDVEVYMQRYGYEISGRRHRDVVFTFKGDAK